MGTRMQKPEPFKEGQNTNDHKGYAPKVKVVSNASQSPSADPVTGVDHLRAALSVRGQVIPSDNHVWTHTTTVRPVGAHYSPAGSFGSVRPAGQHKGVYSYGGAQNKKGDNPLGSNKNRKGDNPLGRAMNRVGTNTAGNNLNRKGSNPIGNNKNRTGEKSGYPAFKPKGGFRP